MSEKVVITHRETNARTIILKTGESEASLFGYEWLPDERNFENLEHEWPKAEWIEGVQLVTLKGQRVYNLRTGKEWTASVQDIILTPTGSRIGWVYVGRTHLSVYCMNESERWYID
jgi:hypothetical protein